MGQNKTGFTDEEEETARKRRGSTRYGVLGRYEIDQNRKIFMINSLCSHFTSCVVVATGLVTGFSLAGTGGGGRTFGSSGFFSGARLVVAEAVVELRASSSAFGGGAEPGSGAGEIKCSGRPSWILKIARNSITPSARTAIPIFMALPVIFFSSDDNHARFQRIKMVMILPPAGLLECV